MKKMVLMILPLVVLFSSCGDKKEDAQKALLDKVLAVHDEVMPLMGDIMKYKKQLNAKIDELIDAGAEENTDQIAKLKEAVKSLENSHDGMMNWMHGFDRNFEGKVQEEVLDYLNDQMTKIEAVAKETNVALQKAEELLAE